jgi:hypothetical protein
VAGVLDHITEQMDTFRELIGQSTESQTALNARLGTLATAVEALTERSAQGDISNDSLDRIAKGQERMISVLEGQETDDQIDAESRMRLRSIDVQMLRILEEISAGRQETMAELRKDISLLAKALSVPRSPEPRRMRTPDKPASEDS